jgi:hypothetical protein
MTRARLQTSTLRGHDQAGHPYAIERGVAATLAP